MYKPPERYFLNKKQNGAWWLSDKPANDSNHSFIEYIRKDLIQKEPMRGPLESKGYTWEKPMKKKTENLTTEEAWIAMARGECVQTSREIFYLYNGMVLKYWDGHFWVNTSALGGGPYSIVSDPSEPKETGISEYDEDRHNLCVDDLPVIKFVEKYFQRKP